MGDDFVDLRLEIGSHLISLTVGRFGACGGTLQSCRREFPFSSAFIKQNDKESQAYREAVARAASAMVWRRESGSRTSARPPQPRIQLSRSGAMPTLHGKNRAAQFERLEFLGLVPSALRDETRRQWRRAAGVRSRPSALRTREAALEEFCGEKFAGFLNVLARVWTLDTRVSADVRMPPRTRSFARRTGRLVVDASARMVRLDAARLGLRAVEALMGKLDLGRNSARRTRRPRRSSSRSARRWRGGRKRPRTSPPTRRWPRCRARRSIFEGVPERFLERCALVLHEGFLRNEEGDDLAVSGPSPSGTGRRARCSGSRGGPGRNRWGAPSRSRMKSMSRWIVFVETSNSSASVEQFGKRSAARRSWIFIIRRSGGRLAGAEIRRRRLFGSADFFSIGHHHVLPAWRKVNGIARKASATSSGTAAAPTPVHQQLELPLAGSHLTRDEAGFLIEIRKLREQLAKAA